MTATYPTRTPTELLAVARLAACAAGDHARLNLGRRHETDSIDRHDVKHKLDVECQQVATATILRAFPGDKVLGEEGVGAATPPPAGAEWIVDPIDGTVNFFHGLPLWCCSVAVRVNGVMTAGVVYAPEPGYCFEASCDLPARCNGALIGVSATTRLDHATIHTGCDKHADPLRSLRFFSAIAEVAQRPRLLGSAALDICLVACGKADAYFENGIYLWDMAAAGLILERAGGRCETLKERGGYRRAVLASNGLLHARLRGRLLPLL